MRPRSAGRSCWFKARNAGLTWLRSAATFRLAPATQPSCTRPAPGYGLCKIVDALSSRTAIKPPTDQHGFNRTAEPQDRESGRGGAPRPGRRDAPWPGLGGGPAARRLGHPPEPPAFARGRHRVRRRRSSTTGWWAAGARPRRKGRVLDGPYDQERQQVRLGADLRRRPYHRLQHPAPHAFPYHRPRLRLVPLRGRSSTRRAGPHLVVAGVVLQGRCWPMIARRHGRAAATLPASYWAAIPHRPARCCLICRLPLVVTDSGGVCWFHEPSVTMSWAATNKACDWLHREQREGATQPR